MRTIPRAKPTRKKPKRKTRKSSTEERNSTLNIKQLTSKLKTAYGYESLKITAIKLAGGSKLEDMSSIRGLTFKFKRKK